MPTIFILLNMFVQQIPSSLATFIKSFFGRHLGAKLRTIKGLIKA
jgi:hypothetical protein